MPVAGGADATMAVGILLFALGSAVDMDDVVWDETLVEDCSASDVRDDVRGEGLVEG